MMVEGRQIRVIRQIGGCYREMVKRSRLVICMSSDGKGGTRMVMLLEYSSAGSR